MATTYGAGRYAGTPETWGSRGPGVVRTAEDRCIDDVDRLVASKLDPLELLRQATERLRHVLPFDWACVNLTDPITGLAVRASMERSGPAARPFFERYYFQDYLPAQRRMVEERQLASVLVDRTRRDDYMAPAGYGSELMMTCAADGDMWGTAHFMRARGADGFSAAEMRLARRIAAMLGPALRREPGRLPVEGLPLEDIGVLVANLDGRIVRRTPAATRLLEELGASTSRPEELAHLPLGMLFLVGSVVRGSSASLNVRIRAVNSGRWLTVEAEAVEAATQEAPEIMIVIRPAPPRDLVDLNAAAFGLTHREREIVRLVVIGTSTREIARALHLSEYTIQEHLQNVFDKTGTANRRSLVGRFLFAELSDVR